MSDLLSRTDSTRTQPTDRLSSSRPKATSSAQSQEPISKYTAANTDTISLTEEADRRAALLDQLMHEPEVRDDVIETALWKLKENPTWPAKEASLSFVKENEQKKAEHKHEEAQDRLRDIAQKLLSQFGD